MTNIDFGAQPARFAHDTFESRLLADRGHVDLSERYENRWPVYDADSTSWDDPTEPGADRIAADYRIFNYYEIALVSISWALVILACYVQREEIRHFLGVW